MFLGVLLFYAFRDGHDGYFAAALSSIPKVALLPWTCKLPRGAKLTLYSYPLHTTFITCI
jgi:hypothetical protein